VGEGENKREGERGNKMKSNQLGDKGRRFPNKPARKGVK